jgi:triacylglycerol lipase
VGIGRRLQAAGVGLMVVLAALIAGPQGIATAADVGPTIGLNQVIDASPPGANNWHCHPSAAHPRPVVLVHGFTGNQLVNWTYLAPILAAHGYCVFSLTYGREPGAPPPLSQVGGLVPMEHSVYEVIRFIDRVRHATGTAKVDVVGHSEGTLVPAYYIKFLGGARYVDNYVQMTPLWKGTTEHGVTTLIAPFENYGIGLSTIAPMCGACQEFAHGSAFLAKMNSDGGPAVDSVHYTEIMSKFDEMVTPYTSGFLHGRHVRNIVLQDHCPLNTDGHVGQAVDPVVAQYVLNGLDPAHPHPVRCYPGGPPV